MNSTSYPAYAAQRSGADHRLILDEAGRPIALLPECRGTGVDGSLLCP